MKTGFLSLFAFSTALTATAHADGFLCVGQTTGLNVKVYNHTDAQAGTRTPAVLVVSDPTAAPGDQTLATFSGDQLFYQGYGTYLATLTPDAYAVENKIIAGTPTAELKTIELAINFSYTSSTTALASAVPSIPGKIAYHKVTGESDEEAISCTRYLKSKKP